MSDDRDEGYVDPFKDCRDPATGRLMKGAPGRLRGTKTIVSEKAVKKLENMGADPLEFLAEMMHNPRISVAARQKAAEKLLDYAYRKQPTLVENTITGAMPVMNVKELEFKEDDDDSNK